MSKVFSCLKGGEERKREDLMITKILGDFWGAREIGFLRALEMQGDKISGGLCGHSLSAMIALLGA
ncbi:hypothetical protein [Bartonella sp. CL27QHWL]|uniref:hypothetical protein n=1 Tax=Bartonella sp. CL27QHWL TaxID=3243521 RepID=UPI0035CEB268